MEKAEWSVEYFNPRSHEGSDPLLRILLRNAQNFNPRSHEGSDAGWSVRTT